MMITAVPIAQISVEAATSADYSVSDDGISLICSLEGFHSKCYYDYAQSSIGYGSKCTGSSTQPHKAGAHSITKTEAKALLKSQLNSTYAPRVRKQTSGVQMSQNQFDALVSLCYNCGGGTDLISNSPLVKYLKGKLSEKEARSQYSNYIVKAGGSVLQGLINRRNKEADFFFGNSSNPTTLSNAEEIIRVARSQKGSYGSDINKFTTWYYGKKQSEYWCAIFLMWCANQVGEYKEAVPNNPGCEGMKNWYNKKGLYHTTNSGYTPQKGDIVFFDTSRSGTYNHVEFVAESGYITKSGVKYVRCIGGNTSNANFKGADYVSEKDRKVTESSCKIIGFAHPKYKGSLKVSITANPVTSSKTTNNSAEFNVGISPEAKVEKIGVFFGKNKDDIKAVTTSTKHEKTSKHNYYLLAEWANGKNKSSFSFDTAKKTTVNKYTIKFDPGKTYYYKFVVKINGDWKISGINNFTSSKDVPAAVTNLNVSGEKKIGIDSSTTVSWKRSEKADSYTVLVTTDFGYRNEQTLKGRDSTTFHTGSLTGCGTYNVSVTAKNSSGDSSASFTSFELIGDRTVSFDSALGTTDREIRTPHYNGSFTTPYAPEREGYRFDGWKNDETGEIVQASTNVRNVKEDRWYTAQWTPKKYTINIVDGITNKNIVAPTKQDFDSEFNVAEFMKGTAVPTHEFYEFVGYSEDVYTVKAETHTIYARYKWASEYSLGTTITSIQRAKSSQSKTANDGYSIDINVTAPMSSDEMGTDQTLKGRVVVALKTDAGRLLIETESAAFVLYPKENEPVTRTINVFVPYETGDKDLPTDIEAYVVNNYYTAGIVSNVASNKQALADANSKETRWLLSDVPVNPQDTLPDGTVVGAINHAEDCYVYDIQTTTIKESTNNSMDGYTYVDSRWGDNGPQWSGYLNYVSNWPSLGNSWGCGFDNTTGIGKSLYENYKNSPYSSSENDGMLLRVENFGYQPIGYIYYHWCRGLNNGKLQHAVKKTKKTTDNGKNVYQNFEAFYSPKDLPTDTYLETSYYCAAWDSELKNASKDSYYWFRIPVYRQSWETYKKVYSFEKQTIAETDRNQKAYVSSPEEINVPQPEQPTPDSEYYPVNPIFLHSFISKKAVNIRKMYAYKPANSDINHTDMNEVDISGYTVNGMDEAKEATLYIYKSTQVSDFTTEYIGNVVIDKTGRILKPVIVTDNESGRSKVDIPATVEANVLVDTIQTRENIKDIGEFTISVALKGETNAFIVGTLKNERTEPYTVTFVNSTGKTDENGNIVYNKISEQLVDPEGSAILPDEADIPVKEGYHFVCWNLSTDIVNGDMTVQAIYEKNEYAVVFVDWDSKKLEVKKVKHGESVVAPELPKPADDVDVEWVIGDGADEKAMTLNEWIENGGTVTEDMIISARYSLKKVDVRVVDLTDSVDPEADITIIENNLDDDNPAGDLPVINEEFEYDDILPLEEYENEYSADCIFIGWKNAATGEYLDSIEVKSDMTIYPVYQFADTVEIPIASVTTGEYTSNQTVTLSCETENAVIYYSTDGTNPETAEVNEDDSDPSGVHIYTEPITLTKPTNLQFCAMAMGMNNSGTVAELYAINTATSGVKYHLVTVYSNLPQDDGAYYQALVKASTKFNTSAFGEIEGYSYEGLFFDAEGEDEFVPNSDLITEETTLYAIYTPNKYTATFNDYDGTQLSTSTVDYGTAAEAPNPTRDGYVFIGWDSDDYEYMTSNKTFTAQYCLESAYARVSLNKPTLTKQEGDGAKLKAIVTPAELSDTELIWETNNAEVATVDQNGMVECLSEGSATITVTVVATGESAECFVTVLPNADKTLYLADGSPLDIDSQRYLRRIPVNANTVSEIKESFANDESKLSFYGIDNAALTDTDLVGTGSVVKLMDGETVLDQITAIMTGDFNGDGIINTRDVSMMSQNVLQLRDASEIQAIAVDVNGDGDVNVRDCAMMSRYLAGKEDIA